MRCLAVLVSAVLFLAPVCHASAVTAEARVLKAKVKIGDEIRLLLKVEHPRKYTLTPPDPKMDLSPFEVKKVEPVPVRRGQNRVEETFRMTLAVFETGDLRIPPIPVEFADEEGRPGRVSAPEVPVQVVSVGKKITDKDDIRPIKGPVSTGLLRFWSGLGAVLASVLAVLLAVLVTRRLLRERKDLESRKPPGERVKLELARLKDRGFLEEKNYKDFYSELSDILRRYLERRFQLEALEKTSAEVVEELTKRSFEPEVTADIREVLTGADLVKFAKFAPPYDLAGRLEGRLLDAVERTRPSPEEKKKK